MQYTNIRSSVARGYSRPTCIRCCRVTSLLRAPYAALSLLVNAALTRVTVATAPTLVGVRDAEVS